MVFYPLTKLAFFMARLRDLACQTRHARATIA